MPGIRATDFTDWSDFTEERTIEHDVPDFADGTLIRNVGKTINRSMG